MVIYKRSLLVSNILDPLTHTNEDLKNIYRRLSYLDDYESIETRLIKDNEMIDYFNQVVGQKFELTYWITGEIQRAKLNLSSVNEEKRIASVELVKSMIKIAVKTNCQWIGLASGCIESTVEEGLIAFQKSISDLLLEIENQKYQISIILEPLDQFAHKCNVIGTLDTILQLLRSIPERFLNHKRLSICFDTAHVALNDDNFETTFQKLAPYISRVHFANAVLNKQSPMYGDYHLPLCQEGFLNLELAREVRKFIELYLTGEITVTMEVRETQREHAWVLEKEMKEFLNEVLR